MSAPPLLPPCLVAVVVVFGATTMTFAGAADVVTSAAKASATTYAKAHAMASTVLICADAVLNALSIAG